MMIGLDRIRVESIIASIRWAGRATHRVGHDDDSIAGRHIMGLVAAERVVVSDLRGTLEAHARTMPATL